MIESVRAISVDAEEAQTEPCHRLVAVVWVGEIRGPHGPVHLYSCHDCGRSWTASPDGPEVPVP